MSRAPMDLDFQLVTSHKGWKHLQWTQEKPEPKKKPAKKAAASTEKKVTETQKRMPSGEVTVTVRRVRKVGLRKIRTTPSRTPKMRAKASAPQKR